MIFEEKAENANKVIEILETLRNGPDQFIWDYFEEIKIQVDLRREILIKEIKNCSAKIIDHIEKTRSECMEINDKSLEQIKRKIDTSIHEINELKNKLKFHEMDGLKLKYLKKELLALEKKRLIEFEELILENKEYAFELDNDTTSEADISNFFGKFLINKDTNRQHSTGYMF